MYTVGSIADIISGNKSPKKQAVQVKEIKYEYEKPVVKTTVKINANKKKLNFEKRIEKKNGKQIPKKLQQKPKATMNERMKPVNVKKEKTEPAGNNILNNKKTTGVKILKNIKIKKGEKFLGPLRIPRPIPEPTVNEILNNKNINNANKRVSLKRKNAETPHIKVKKPKFTNDDSKDRTIFVGNVPLGTKENEIRQFLSSYGPIETVRFRSVPIANLKLPRKVAVQQAKFHPKRKSMNAYVCFKSSEDATKAKNANGTEFKNFHLRVDSLRVPQPKNNKKAIFISNLPFDVEEEDVRKVFQDCGAIDSVRLIRDRKTNIGKGIGYVNFKSTDGVHLALQLEDVKVGNRQIRVSMSNYKSQEDTNKKKTPEGKKIRERFAIHIDNLPEETTETDLRDLFKPCGTILSVRIKRGREGRFCFVNFKYGSSVQNALKLRAPVTQLNINECKPKTDKNTDPKKRYPSIYIRNLPLSATEGQLLQLFKNCGKIMSVKIFNKVKSFQYVKIEKAVGFVNFETDKSVELALTKTVKIGNNQLEISRKVDKAEKREAPKIEKQNVSLADSDEPSEEEDTEDLDDEEVEDEDDDDYEDAEETEELDEEEEDSNDEVDNESDDE